MAKGKKLVWSQEEFCGWLDQTKVQEALIETDTDVPQAPQTYPCVVVWATNNNHAACIYVELTDFIKK